MSEAEAVQARRKIRFVEFYRGRCAKSTAYEWVKQGKLRLYKVGGMSFTDMTFDEFVEHESARADGGSQ
jgi:hypothetical protein